MQEDLWTCNLKSELEKELKIVNEVLFSLGREMEQHLHIISFINKRKNFRYCLYIKVPIQFLKLK